MTSERLGCAAVAFSKGPDDKQYEDRYALFPLANSIFIGISTFFPLYT